MFLTTKDENLFSLLVKAVLGNYLTDNQDILDKDGGDIANDSPILTYKSEMEYASKENILAILTEVVEGDFMRGIFARVKELIDADKMKEVIILVSNVWQTLSSTGVEGRDRSPFRQGKLELIRQRRC